MNWIEYAVNKRQEELDTEKQKNEINLNCKIKIEQLWNNILNKNATLPEIIRASRCFENNFYNKTIRGNQQLFNTDKTKYIFLSNSNYIGLIKNNIVCCYIFYKNDNYYICDYNMIELYSVVFEISKIEILLRNIISDQYDILEDLIILPNTASSNNMKKSKSWFRSLFS